MSREFFEVVSMSELFDKCHFGEEEPRDPEMPEWVSQLRKREDLDGWMVAGVWSELDYAVTFFWKVASETFRTTRTDDARQQEPDADFFERCLSNHLYSLQEMYDGDIALEPVAFLLEMIDEHEGEPFHPAMLLIAYAIWSLDKAIAGLLNNDISDSTYGSTICGSAISEAILWQLKTPAGIEMMNKIVQTKRALDRHAVDPKQAAKANVREHWKQWQNDHRLHKGKAAFARAMLKMFTVLDSQKVIEDWCRDWEKQKNEESRKSAGH